MRGLILRTFALGLRFAAPLVLLALSNEEQLGTYYLFIAFYTLAVTVSGLEASLYFSRRLLQHAHHARRSALLWWQFLRTITLFGLAAGAVAATIAWCQFDYSLALTPLVLLFLVSETIANEAGRLMWLLGRATHASRTDFARALGMVLAVSLAAWTTGSMLSPIFFVVLTLVNSLVIGWHARQILEVNGLPTVPFPAGAWSLRSAIRIGHDCLAFSGPQFVYSQAIGVWVLFERHFLDHMFGKATLGGYALAGGIIGAGTSILLQPRLSRYRARYLRLPRPEHTDRLLLFIASARLIALFSFATCLAAYMMVPLLNQLLNKNVELPLTLAIAAGVSTTSISICGQIGIAFPRRQALAAAGAGCGLTLLLLMALPRLGFTEAVFLLALHTVVQIGMRYALLHISHPRNC